MTREEKLKKSNDYNAYSKFKGTLAHEYHEEIYGVYFSGILFMENYKSINNLLKKYSTAEACESLSRLDHEFKKTHLEVTRCFINFIYTATALRDLSRNSTRNTDYLELEFQKNNESKVDEHFKSQPVVKFIEDIRNVMMHQSLIPVILNQSYTSNISGGMSPFKFGFAFNCEDLLKLDRITKVSREYIESHQRRIYFHEFITEYKNLVCGYQSWLLKNLYKKHREKYCDFWVAQEQYVGQWDGVILHHFNTEPTKQVN